MLRVIPRVTEETDKPQVPISVDVVLRTTRSKQHAVQTFKTHLIDVQPVSSSSGNVEIGLNHYPVLIQGVRKAEVIGLAVRNLDSVLRPHFVLVIIEQVARKEVNGRTTFFT